MDLKNIASFRNYSQKCFKNRVQISRFLTLAKIRGRGGGWVKFLRCVIEFDLGPNMWYNFYDALLGSLGD